MFPYRAALRDGVTQRRHCAAHNDMFVKKADGRIGTSTNRSGGIQGGNIPGGAIGGMPGGALPSGGRRHAPHSGRTPSYHPRQKVLLQPEHFSLTVAQAESAETAAVMPTAAEAAPELTLSTWLAIASAAAAGIPGGANENVPNGNGDLVVDWGASRWGIAEGAH